MNWIKIIILKLLILVFFNSCSKDEKEISVIKESKRILIVIKDNGDGFDFSERYNDFKSLGLKTLRERTKYLKGTMKVDSEKNKGTTFSYIIPIA